MPVCDKCTMILSNLDISYSAHIASAHRTPKHLESVIENAIKEDCKVFIGMAGMAAALPGVIASMTSLPVIGVPIGGNVPFDSLLSIVQMPPGMPVATVGVGRGDNAAILAGQILSLSDSDLSSRIIQYRKNRAKQVLLDDKELRK